MYCLKFMVTKHDQVITTSISLVLTPVSLSMPITNLVFKIILVFVLNEVFRIGDANLYQLDITFEFVIENVIRLAILTRRAVV